MNKMPTSIEIENVSEVQVPTTIKVTIRHHYDEQKKTGQTSIVWYFHGHAIAFQEVAKWDGDKTVIIVDPYTTRQIERKDRLSVYDKLEKEAIEGLEPNPDKRLQPKEFYKKLDDLMDAIIPNAWAEQKYFSM